MEVLLTVAVLGHGPKACEIAGARARAGHAVRIYAPHGDALADAVARIRAAAGALPAAERQRTLDGILATTDLAEALDGAALVVDHR